MQVYLAAVNTRDTDVGGAMQVYLAAVNTRDTDIGGAMQIYLAAVNTGDIDMQVSYCHCEQRTSTTSTLISK